MSEIDFWGNCEEHHGEMDEWKSEKCENDGMEGGWNEDDVGWMIDEYARWWAWCRWDDERRHGMWLQWIDEYDERGDRVRMMMWSVMWWNEMRVKMRRGESAMMKIIGKKRKWRNEGSEEWHRVESVSEEVWKWECIEMEWGLREKYNGDIGWMKGSDSWCD